MLVTPAEQASPEQTKPPGDEAPSANDLLFEEREESVTEATLPPNKGTLIADASCVPADIAYPTDLNLLNEAREKLEAIIDRLHEPLIGKAPKPRTYREKAASNIWPSPSSTVRDRK